MEHSVDVDRYCYSGVWGWTPSVRPLHDASVSNEGLTQYYICSITPIVVFAVFGLFANPSYFGMNLYCR